MARSDCRNFNHGRANAPVRCCPSCGEIVNAAVATRACRAAEHDRRRRDRDAFCVDCGAVLRVTT